MNFFSRSTNLFSHMHPTLVAEKEIVSLTSLSKIDGLYLLCAMGCSTLKRLFDMIYDRRNYNLLPLDCFRIWI